MTYCDGASFAGDVEEPGPYGGKSLYFRGFRILKAILNDLLMNHNLKAATDVLLTGCSAGGLATYLHADFVGEWLNSTCPNLARYKAMPGSGFFLLANNVLGEAVYPNQMEVVFNMQNASGGVNQDCIKALGPVSNWRCIFAEYSYNFTKTPIFALNSAYDMWQLMCIFTSIPVLNMSTNGDCAAVTGWFGCLNNISSCTVQDFTSINQYHSKFISDISQTVAWGKPGNGAFIDSCYSHCEFQPNKWVSIRIGGTSMQEAVSKWWNESDQPASSNTYVDCDWSNTSGPCDTSCPHLLP